MAEENGNVQVDLRITIRTTRRGYTAYLNIAGERFQGSSSTRVDAIYQLFYYIVGSSSLDRFKDALELLLDGTTFNESVPASTATERTTKKHDDDKK